MQRMKSMRETSHWRILVEDVNHCSSHRLHSLDTRLHMLKYKIGRVEGRWTNFIPPIQGGLFRPFIEDDDEEEVEGDDNNSASSQDESPPRSPVFDPIELPRAGCRWRGCTPENEETSSISSVSSTELDEAPEEPRLGHLNACTQKEIELDLEKYPPLDPATQDDIVDRYRILNDRIKAEGLYQCNYTAYLKEICRYSLLLGFCLLFLRWGWYGTSGVLMGMFWHQLVFTAHDAGHMGITHDFTIDTIIGVTVADYLGGLSLGWWKRSHNVHHIVTNSPEHDPDIEHMPFFVSTRGHKVDPVWLTVHLGNFASLLRVSKKYISRKDNDI